MASVPPAFPEPTDLAALPELLANAQQLDLTPHLQRSKRGLSTLAASLLWLWLAWRGSGHVLEAARSMATRSAISDS